MSLNKYNQIKKSYREHGLFTWSNLPNTGIAITWVEDLSGGERYGHCNGMGMGRSRMRMGHTGMGMGRSRMRMEHWTGNGT